jgi:hypothetical protein
MGSRRIKALGGPLHDRWIDSEPDMHTIMVPESLPPVSFIATAEDSVPESIVPRTTTYSRQWIMEPGWVVPIEYWVHPSVTHLRTEIYAHSHIEPPCPVCQPDGYAEMMRWRAAYERATQRTEEGT